MTKVFTILSIHSCPGQKIGLGNSGGLNIYVKNLIEFLLKKEKKVFLISKKHKDCDFESNYEDFKLIHIDIGEENFFLKKISDETDVLISNYYTSGKFSQKYFTKENLLKINISHTLEYLKKEHYENYKIDNKRIEIERSVLEFFDFTLSFSKLETDILINKYLVPKAKIINSTPGFDQKYFYRDKIISKNKSENINNDEKLILFVGRNDYLKGLDLAIESLNIALRQNESIRLGIVGGDLGSEKQKDLVKDLSNKNISKKIYWFGSVPQNKLREYYKSSSLVIIPSRSETFGIVCLEALSSETPVIVSKTGRMQDFVNHMKNGIVLDRLSSIELSKNIIKFFENIDQFIITENDHKKLKKFEWQNVLEDLYKKISI
jgi:glycosyltransferase involved in cell wall biosynthesis